ncbi:MAG: DAK2 domain-containing protein [Phascolarctobacterium sp.]|nr:DAK2 domain-containing protein [Candidatus Phascolarctobacterium caballi]
MAKEIITGKEFRAMLLGAYHSFEKNFEVINNLNVFPVPDGDTGTNMLHTMTSVAKAISVMNDKQDIGEIGSQMAKAAIMGARGNSGVILSQLLRGIGKGVAGKKTVNTIGIGKAFQYGILYAYRSVANPVNGTILSVARAMAKGTYNIARTCNDLETVLQELIRCGETELAKTPEQLPALKAAGVVDAGGQGLICFFKGCLSGLKGEDCAVIEVTAAPKITSTAEEPLDLECPYCTEFIVKGTHVTKETVQDALKDMGNSMIVAVVDDIVKVHIHSRKPGQVLLQAQEWGTLHDLKIENMIDQHNERLFVNTAAAPQKKGKVGVLTVAPGEGLAEMMHKMGAAGIISGGQSMNPSVEDFVNIINKGEYDEYIILPNNKNIILAAEQVRKLLGAGKVSYVGTTSVAQGLAALLHFDPERSAEENKAVMSRAAHEAVGGSVTVAVRDSVVSGIKVQKGDYLGLINEKIICTGGSIKDVLAKMLKDKDYELISIYYGDALDKAAAQNLAQYIETLGDFEVECFAGGQPNYPLILAME